MPTGSPPIDMVGQKFGRWTVTGLDHRTERRRIYWACVCECGAKRAVLGNALRSGKSQSCGCLQREVVSENRTTHGLHQHPAYNTFRNMHRRCEDATAQGYELYGGRGIAVCERWATFEDFWRDMGATWKPGLSIERVNNDLGYYPANCRWATAKEQGANRRDNVLIMTPAGKMTVSEAATRFGIERNTIFSRMRYGWKEEDLLQPVTKDNSRRQPNVMINTPEGPMIASRAAKKYGLGVPTLFARIRAGWPEADLLRPSRQSR